MNILFLNPPFQPKFSRSQRSPAVTKSGTLYYPFWLAYATGVAEDAGHTCKLVDAPADGSTVEQLVKLVQDFQPELVIMDTSTPSLVNDLKVAAALKEAKPDVWTFMVGPHISGVPEEPMRRSAAVDGVCRKEYEYTVLELVQARRAGLDWGQIQGLTWRKGYDENGAAIIANNPERPPIDDLDSLPFVSRVYGDHLDIMPYFYAITPYPVMTIITGRGCPYHCNYCLFPQTFTGHLYRYRSVENVVAEFQYIQERFPQVKHIFIEDDTLTANKERARQLSRALIAVHNKLTFTCNARADVDFETLDLMHKAGCRMMCVGFEAGDQAVLNSIKKGMKLERMHTFVQNARKSGVLVHGCFMVGNPGDTRATVHKTLELAKQLNPDTAQFFPLMVYPGTEAYTWAVDNGRLKATDWSEWLTADGLHNCVTDLPDMSSSELVEFCDHARRQFYFRPRYIFSKARQVMTRPEELKRVIKATARLVPFMVKRAGHDIEPRRDAETVTRG